MKFQQAAGIKPSNISTTQTTPMHKDWQILHRYLDSTPAQLEVGRLTAEGIPALIESDMLLPGLTHEHRVLVPAIYKEQADKIVAQSQINEKELTELALQQNPQD